MQDFGDRLKSYSLFTFEKRLFGQALIFAKTIVENGSLRMKFKEFLDEKIVDYEILDTGSLALTEKEQSRKFKFGQFHLSFKFLLSQTFISNFLL